MACLRGWETGRENPMDIMAMVWINTLALIAAAALTLREIRKISQALRKGSETPRRHS